MSNCAFLGLGVMGGPMARHLGKALDAAGHNLKVWNRSPAKLDAWIAAGNTGQRADDARVAIAGCEYIFMCLGDDPDVEAVMSYIEPYLMPAAIVVDHTTGSAGLARRWSEKLAKDRRYFVDAPVSGGQAGAEAGQLTIMCGGDDYAVANASKVMAAYAKAITHIGESGQGQLAKAVNQICIAGVVQGLSEGLHFAKANGLDPERVISAISKGAAQSWQMENRWKTMVAGKFDFGFAVDWMRKDLRIALEAARETGATLPVTALVDQFYAEVQEQGGGRWDTSSLISRLNR